jgi:hypothetical protein
MNLNLSLNICCDNSGENHDIQNYLRERSPKMRCKFEYIESDSPQQNEKIERKFAALYGRVRACLNRAEFTPTLRNVMWAKWVSANCTDINCNQFKNISELLIGNIDDIWCNNKYNNITKCTIVLRELCINTN